MKIPRYLYKALGDVPRWVAWRYADTANGRRTKRPIGSTKDPKTWSRLADFLTPGFAGDGVGLVMTDGLEVDGGRLLAIDADACRCPITETIARWAEELLEAAGPTLVEVSPSGTGLRIWVLVEEKPEPIRKIRIAADPPIGVEKTPEIQVFGAGPAGFVTVTGTLHPGSTDVPRVHARLSDALGELAAVTVPEVEVELPKGSGPAPTTDEVEKAVLCAPSAAELVAGDYIALGLPSASEAWYRLVRVVLGAARNHGEVAVAFLLSRTAFGAGLVDSREPERYTRPSWVRTDVARIAGKDERRDAVEVFSERPLDPSWEPTKPSRATTMMQSRLHGPSALAARLGAVEFLVERAFPRTGIVQVFGDPKSGKSTVAVSLAVHVAAGADSWFGRKMPFGTGKVAVISGEGTKGLVARFLVAAREVGLDDIDARIRISRGSGALSDPRDVEAWIEDLRAFAGEGGPPIRLVVIDTQARNFGPGNEDKVEDVGRFVAGLQAISDAFDALVVVVHHTGHAEKGRGRGSSSMEGALDAAVRVDRTASSVRLRWAMVKDFAEPEELRATLASRPTTADGEATSVVLAETPFELDRIETEREDLLVDRVVEALGAAPEGLSMRQILQQTSGRDQDLKRAVQRAVDLDKVEQIKVSEKRYVYRAKGQE